MKQHQYQITVSELLDDSSATPQHMQFDVGIHDDLFVIFERLKRLNGFTENEAATFCIGLKLFGKTLIEKKDSELFAEMKPQFVAFMKKLKSSVS
jgi:hypothetical protein